LNENRPLRIMLITEYFPPEIGAGSTRAYELARRWSQRGTDVTVVTGFPDYPDGIIPESYRGHVLLREKIDTINVVRTYIYAAPNKGFLKRSISYVSFMFSSILQGTIATKKQDLLVASSPPFLVGVAGFVISRLKRIPFIFEVRDIWPASIVQLGQIKNKMIIHLLEWIELFLYRRAAKVVCVTDSFVEDIKARGIPESKMAVIKNGVDLVFFKPDSLNLELQNQLNLKGKTVVSYIGTHGLSHALDKILDAASLLHNHKELVFLFIGDGAEKEKLIKKSQLLKLNNVRFLASVNKSELSKYYSISDILLVPLRGIPLFKTVIPSKIFEIMAVKKPILLSVDGESRQIVEEAGAGMFVEPENPQDLKDKILELIANPEKVKNMGENGRLYVEKYFDRDRLADQYLDLIESIVTI
jgi:glycosyltransferase involved in cell wall biosynthesis